MATTHFKMFLTDARPEQLAVALNRTDYTQDDKAVVEFDLVGTVVVTDVPTGAEAPVPDVDAAPASEEAATTDPALIPDIVASSIEEADAAQLIP